MSKEAIFEYFQSRFGDIKWLAIHNSLPHRFAVLKFRLADAARNASARSQHTIAGHVVHVSIAHQVQEKHCNFLSMDDECIGRILEYLERKDLCSMADMCSRLRKLSRKRFSSIYDGQVLEWVQTGESIEDCLRNFGSLITSIRLERSSKLNHYDVSHILGLLQKNCSRLISLEANLCFYNKDEPAENLVDLFSRLQQVKLTKCAIPYGLTKIIDVPELFLDVVRVYDWDISNIWEPKIRYSHVKTIKFFEEYYAGSLESCQRAFILEVKSNTLEHIEIDSYIERGFWGRISTFLSIKTLKVYSRLVYTGDDEENDEFLDEMIPTSDSWQDSWKFLKNLSKLSELTLSCHRKFTVDNLLGVIRHGQSIQQLIIIFHNEADPIEADPIEADPIEADPIEPDPIEADLQNNAIKFQEMLNFVSQRPDEKPLSVIIVAKENQIGQFENTIPTDAPLKIACLSVETVTSILKIKPKGIKMSTEQIKVLRENGLLQES